MSKMSIKVVVAGRSYPLSVNESEQAKVLQAAEDINRSIKMLQDNYAVKDMQDLLAMTALQLAIKPAAPQTSAPQDFKAVEEKLQALSDELNQLNS
jgi:cell division protein ZapA (FtsZ GTPase activity inhibitor)